MKARVASVGLVAGGVVLLSLALAFFVAPHASGDPDGLEKVAEQHGFAGRAESDQVFTQGPMPDYKARGVQDETLSTGLAGLAGTLGVLAVTLGLGKLLTLRRKPTQAAAA